MNAITWIKNEWNDEYMGGPFKVIVCAAVAVVIVIIAAIVLTPSDADFARDCAAKGGTVSHHQGVVVIAQPKGGVTVVPTTVRDCTR